MKTKILLLFIAFFIILSCQERKETKNKLPELKKEHKAQTKNTIPEQDTITIEYLNKHNSYDYETKLRNGYDLEFKYFRENKNSSIEMCLNLKKGNTLIDTLNIMGYGAPHKNLGYVGADYNNYFAFVNSFGSGNPHEFRLIEKSTGKTIKSGFIVDSFKKPEFLLYTKGYDSLMLYDMEKKKDNYIEDLAKSKEIDLMVSELSDGLKIKKVTAKYVVIEIENHENKIITKKYNR
ncbi:hypothetical protein ACFFLS_03645 [Flavobacterium procerum]|uniref:Lipoprotein n=1 Tax=Flavobacterium procerum TaxID=1455569 RepID=A0ABV6BL02_9FLAO